LTSFSFSICITSAAVLAIRILLSEKMHISLKAVSVPALGYEQISNLSLERPGFAP
jgi:hypothetical protein